MSILDTISSPADLRELSPDQLAQLSEEIRAFIIEKVSANGGHLSPNLGVVELTLALHRVFDSPNDRIIWDVGHQAYVHKLVTGRSGDFDRLRHTGGLSGYPSREESPSRLRREQPRIDFALLRPGARSRRVPRVHDRSHR